MPGSEPENWSNLPKAYLSLGGNIGNSRAILHSAMQHIKALDGIVDFRASRLYRTSPVSDMSQPSFVNAACCFRSGMDVKSLAASMQSIERLHGKIPKAKNAPRIVDIDILFFGVESHSTPELEVPHPRWRERLFVIEPLLDLASVIAVPCPLKGIELVDIVELKRTFSNPHQETVSVFIETEGELCLSLK